MDSPDTPSKRNWLNRSLTLSAVAMVVAASMLVVVLGLMFQPADPPRNLSVSLGLLDEGIWSHNSVNGALFGRARTDDLNPMFVTSVPPVLMRASYSVFGVGIRQTRLPSIILGFLIVLGIGLLFLRVDQTAAVVGSVLLATTYLFLGYTRLGLLETTAAALCFAATACLVFALEKSRLWPAIAGGALLAAAVTSKPQVGGSVLGIIAGLIAWRIAAQRRGLLRLALAALSSFAVVVVVWAAFVLSHWDAAVRSEWKQHALGIGLQPGQIIRNASRYVRSSDGVGSHAGPLLIAAAVGVVLQAIAFALGRYRPGALAWAGAGWALAGLGAVAAISYQPSRYAILALPGCALIAASGVVAARTLIPRNIVTLLALAGVIAGATIGLSLWAQWARHPEWSLRDAARILRSETMPTDVIGGGFMLIPATEAHRRVVTILPLTTINARCPVERFGIDYVVLPDRDKVGEDFYNRFYPGLTTPQNLVTTFQIFRNKLSLFRVPRPRPASWSCASG